MITVTGGTAQQRRLAEICVQHALDELMPRMKNIYITVELVDIKSAATGWCSTGEDHRDIEIEVDRKQGLFAIASTILHEMVHAKQYARREIDGVNMMWRGEPVAEGTDYSELPWEVEAYKMQDILLSKLVDKDLF